MMDDGARYRQHLDVFGGELAIPSGLSLEHRLYLHLLVNELASLLHNLVLLLDYLLQPLEQQL